MMSRSPTRSSVPGRTQLIDKRRKAVLFEGPSAIIPGIHTTAAETAAPSIQGYRRSRGVLNSAFSCDEEEQIDQSAHATHDDETTRDHDESHEKEREPTISPQNQPQFATSKEKHKDSSKSQPGQPRNPYYIDAREKRAAQYSDDAVRKFAVVGVDLSTASKADSSGSGGKSVNGDNLEEEERGSSALDLAREISKGHVPDSLVTTATTTTTTTKSRDCKPRKSRGILKKSSTHRTMTNKDESDWGGDQNKQEPESKSRSPSTESRLQRIKPPHLSIRTDLEVPAVHNKGRLQRQMALDLETPMSQTYNGIYDNTRSYYKAPEINGYYNSQNSWDLNEPVLSPFIVRFVDDESYPQDRNISEKIEYVPNDAIWQTRHEMHKQYGQRDVRGGVGETEAKMLGDDRVQLDVSKKTFKKIARQLSVSGRHQENYNVELASYAKPRNFFDLAVFTCFCCLSPLGLVAIVTSAMTDIKYQDGEYAKSIKYSKASLGLSVAGIISTILLAVIVVWTTAYPFGDDH